MGVQLTSRFGRFTPGNKPGTVIYDACLAPGPVWTVANRNTYLYDNDLKDNQPEEKNR
jgi:hypothetical protein